MMCNKEFFIIFIFYLSLQNFVFADKLDKACEDSKKFVVCNDKETAEGTRGVVQARPREFPFMATIGFGEAADSTTKWLCGGSLISDRWVLTVAHCARARSFGTPPKWIKVGDLDINSTTDDARPQIKKITKIMLHPDYNGTSFYNDLALLKLESPVVFDEYVSPICLHNKKQIPVEKARISGWGSVDRFSVGPVRTHLMKVDLPLVNGTECYQLYEKIINERSLSRGIDNDLMICAGEKLGGEEICQGISGAPLTIAQDGGCRRSQIGISSFSRGCGLPDSPGVYTRVSAFIPWIKSVLNETH